MTSLKAIEPGSGIRGALPWPTVFNAAGKQALYVFNGDIFLLDLDSSTFSRLTQTPEEEKDPEFSPNGRYRLLCARQRYLPVGPVREEGERSSPTMVRRRS